MTSEVDFKYGQECSICLDSFDENTSVSASCGHSFHPVCIKGWIDEKGGGLKDVKCPNCMESTLRVQELTLQSPEVFPPRIRIKKIATWGSRASFNCKKFYALSSAELTILENMQAEPLAETLNKSVYVSRGALSNLSSKYKDLEAVKDVKQAYKLMAENPSGQNFRDLPSMTSPVRGFIIKLGVFPLAFVGGVSGGVIGLGVGGIRGAIVRDETVGHGALTGGIAGAVIGGGVLGATGLILTSKTMGAVETVTGSRFLIRHRFKKSIVRQVNAISRILKIKSANPSLDDPDFQEKLGKLDSLELSLWETFSEEQKKTIYAHFSVYQDEYMDRSPRSKAKIDRMLLKSLINFESDPGSYKKVRCS